MSLNISLITPAAKRSLNGNRVTAVRWARLLDELGHRVRIEQRWQARDRVDAMVAIHAYRSAESIARYRERYPEAALIVLMAGTDVYRFQHSHPDITHRSMAHADCLVGLHDDVALDVPPRFRGRVVVVHQSAEPLAAPRRPGTRHVDVCVIGHLRDEKDPLRAALAARELPADSRVRVLHFGDAHSAQWAHAARAEMDENPRYRWLGAVPRWKVRRRLAHVHAMVISSRMEGGANVVSEAVVAGVPVLASNIAGNRGLLGPAHPAYFPVGDASALCALLERTETDPQFLEAVAASGASRQHLFTPERERDGWRRVLAGVTSAT